MKLHLESSACRDPWLRGVWLPGPPPLPIWFCYFLIMNTDLQGCTPLPLPHHHPSRRAGRRRVGVKPQNIQSSNSGSQTVVCIQSYLQGLLTQIARHSTPDFLQSLVGLGQNPRLCISNRLQVLLKLLVWDCSLRISLLAKGSALKTVTLL